MGLLGKIAGGVAGALGGGSSGGVIGKAIDAFAKKRSIGDSDLSHGPSDPRVMTLGGKRPRNQRGSRSTGSGR